MLSIKQDSFTQNLTAYGLTKYHTPASDSKQKLVKSSRFQAEAVLSHIEIFYNLVKRVS